MDIQDVRRNNLRRAVDELEHGNMTALAERARKPLTQISDMLSGRKAFGEKVARAIESRLGLPTGWMDQPHGTVHVGASTTSVETVTVGPPLRQPDPVLLSRAVGEAMDAFRRKRLVPTDAALARAIVLAYQTLATGVALAASRRALDEALQKAITEEPTDHPKQE